MKRKKIITEHFPMDFRMAFFKILFFSSQLKSYVWELVSPLLSCT